MTSSSQARIFYGFIPILGNEVVIKQYKGDLRGFFREIRAFTELERAPNNQDENSEQV